MMRTRLCHLPPCLLSIQSGVNDKDIILQQSSATRGGFKDESAKLLITFLFPLPSVCLGVYVSSSEQESTSYPIPLKSTKCWQSQVWKKILSLWAGMIFYTRDAKSIKISSNALFSPKNKHSIF